MYRIFRLYITIFDNTQHKAPQVITNHQQAKRAQRAKSAAGKHHSLSSPNRVGVHEEKHIVSENETSPATNEPSGCNWRSLPQVSLQPITPLLNKFGGYQGTHVDNGNGASRTNISHQQARQALKAKSAAGKRQSLSYRTSRQSAGILFFHTTQDPGEGRGSDFL
jgi:hypothetical protein